MSDGGFSVKGSPDNRYPPFDRSFIWYAEERQGSAIFNELGQATNYLKLSIMKIKGSLATPNYTWVAGDDTPEIRFYKNDTLIPFTEFNTLGQYTIF